MARQFFFVFIELSRTKKYHFRAQAIYNHHNHHQHIDVNNLLYTSFL